MRFKAELLLMEDGMELAEAAAKKLDDHKKSLSDVIPFFHFVISSVRHALESRKLRST